MPNERLSMRRVREILRLRNAGASIRDIGCRVGENRPRPRPARAREYLNPPRRLRHRRIASIRHRRKSPKNPNPELQSQFSQTLCGIKTTLTYNRPPECPRFLN